MEDFEKWWTKERERAGKDYVLMGPFALRNIAMCAWKEGWKMGWIDATNPTESPQTKAETPDAP